MTFWIVISAIAITVIALLGRALLRDEAVEAPSSRYDLKVYRDQLAEVDRDVARGVLSAGDAERVRTEISRRILSVADRAAPGSAQATRWTERALLTVLVVGLLGGSIAIYVWQGAPGYGDLALQDRISMADAARANRPSQAVALESLPERRPGAISPDFADLMGRLRQAVSERPDDLEGQSLLARNEARLGNMVAATEAQQAVVRIKGVTATATDHADLGELLVLAAGGYVSPEAENAFREALDLDPDDGRARYYIGLMMVQTGRPDIGFRLWDTLLRRGPAQAPWIEPISAQIMSVAQLAGVDYTLPAVGSAARGPSDADIAAAAQMTPEERMEMIGGMVAGLSDRLASEGGPARDWARLITSLALMGNPAQARAVYENALVSFADQPGALDTIRAAAEQAGLAE